MQAIRIQEFDERHARRCEKVPIGSARPRPLLVKFQSPGAAATEFKRGEVVYVALEITRRVITRKGLSYGNTL